MHSQLNISGIPVYVDGAGPETILMLHGWPDTHEVWSPQVEYFKEHYTCVRFTLPGFDDPETRGFSADEIVEIVERIVNEVSPNDRITLMLHDWGCLFGYQYAALHPTKVSRIVAIDVGDASSAEFSRGLSIRAKLMVFSYQILLALTWYMNRTAGGHVTRYMARSLGCKADPQSIHAGMNYPYAMRWMGTLGGLDKLLDPTTLRCPVFYAYGRYKPFQFHSAGWLKRLGETPGSEVRPFKSGHWVMVDCAEVFNDAASEWLMRTN